MFPIWSKSPSAFLFQCWCQAGTWIPPGRCCTFLEREKKKSITALSGGSLGCHPGVQNLLLHSTPSLPHGAVWEDPQAPCTLISCPEDQRVQSKAQTEPAFASKPSRRSLDRVAEGNLGQLPLQLTSGCCRSNPHPFFLSPHYALALLSLPPSSGFCSLPSCFPSVLLPHLTWQWKAN